MFIGTPVADVFAIYAKEQTCIMILGDGVNWGERSRLAARCAVRGRVALNLSYYVILTYNLGAMDYLMENIYGPRASVRTTEDIFHYLLQAFHSGIKMVCSYSHTSPFGQFIRVCLSQVIN